MLEIRPLAGALGAEVGGVRLARLDDEAAWQEIHAAFVRYSVLVFRDQGLEPADIMRIGDRFGGPCHYPFVTGMEDSVVVGALRQSEFSCSSSLAMSGDVGGAARSSLAR